MKKLMILLVLILTACSNKTEDIDPTFENNIQEYIVEEEIDVINRYSFDDEVLTYQTPLEVGMIHFIEEDFDVERRSVPFVGDDLELLHIGNDDKTYFGIIIRNQELFEEATEIQVSIPLSDDPFVFDTTGEYQLMMVMFIEDMSITSCAADGFKVLKGTEVIYEESFIPTWTS